MGVEEGKVKGDKKIAAEGQREREGGRDQEEGQQDVLVENKEHTMRRQSRHLPGTKNGTKDKLSEKGSVA